MLVVAERDYATTLQIRQTVPPLAAVAAAPPCGGELWTCPVHGRVLRLVPAARVCRVYDVAARLDTVHEDVPTTRANNDTVEMAHVAASRDDRAMTSPFYHELEPTTLDSGFNTPSCY